MTPAPGSPSGGEAGTPPQREQFIRAFVRDGRVYRAWDQFPD
jgi:hypothetical protein